MNRTQKLLILLCGIFLVPTLLDAQINFNGSRGLTYVHSAWTVDPGFLTVTSHSRVFGKTANFPDSSISVRNVSGRLNVNYGLNEHFEISVTPLLYQDTNFEGNEVNAPDDLFLSVKAGSFTAHGSKWAYGGLLSLRFPTGYIHNLPLEPYSTNHVSFGLMGLITHATNPVYPEEGTNIHLNLGYWFHNDVGAELIKGNSDVTPESMSQELLYGFGVRVPGEKVDFSAELFGNIFTSKPPRAAYSRENYVYLAPTFFYKASKWVTLNFGVDVRVTNSDDETLYAPAENGVPRIFPDPQPNYAAWRLNLGAKFTLLSSTIYRTHQRDLLMQKAESREELFQQILKEQREAESAEAELERIRTERIRAEQELERLRRILEEDEQQSREKESEPNP